MSLLTLFCFSNLAFQHFQKITPDLYTDESVVQIVSITLRFGTPLLKQHPFVFTLVSIAFVAYWSCSGLTYVQLLLDLIALSLRQLNSCDHLNL